MVAEVCLPGSTQEAESVSGPRRSTSAWERCPQQLSPSECPSLRSSAVDVPFSALGRHAGKPISQEPSQATEAVGVVSALDQTNSRIELRRRNRLSGSQVPGETFVHVRDGILALEAVPTGCRRQILDFLMPGDTFPASVGITVPGFCLRALTKATLDKSPFAAGDGASARCLEATGLLRMLSSLMLRHNLHQIMIGQLDSVSRVSSFLLMLALRRYPALGTNLLLPLPMSRDDIADYLAMNSDTLSRIMMRLESLRIIRRLNRHAVNLIDPQRLGQLSPIRSLLFTALGSTALNDLLTN
jgi:CRP/FNR family transcriptional regulator